MAVDKPYLFRATVLILQYVDSHKFLGPRICTINKFPGGTNPTILRILLQKPLA